MVGAGAIVFAIMGYVISHMRPDARGDMQVRLNPVLLSAAIGEPVEAVEKAIVFLCSPDPKSTTKARDGRRLESWGEFDYLVVNGAKYAAIRSREEQMEANRIYQQRHRDKERVEKLARAGAAKNARARKLKEDSENGAVQGKQDFKAMLNEDSKHAMLTESDNKEDVRAGDVKPDDVDF